jgi:non-specific serine/threonine protein kinase
MSVLILHGKSSKKLDEDFKNQEAFLTITTYQMAARLDCLQDQKWRCLILDEAQAIKNPRTKQTRSIKMIQSRMRISMTGTPVENDLSNLWSQFDFLDQGLLGTLTEFKGFVKGLSEHTDGYLKLKNMISPFMLRRVKTDKSIISDLPERIERKTFITLTNKQKVLYRKYVDQLEQRLIAANEEGSDIKKKGLILGSLIKLKQICNHPDQYLGEGSFEPDESGKFAMLKEICTKIYEKRVRVLVFTQFKEMTEPLADYLEEVFSIRGYVIDGSTPVKKRNAIVEKFQSDAYIPYLVISVKAGGTGLNLTKANHVIHFDRWWNPAVEDQATDRAFRIGQKKNVIVHKFVCVDTIEEKIDELIESKKNLQDSIISTTGENWITNLSDDQLLDMLKLD